MGVYSTDCHIYAQTMKHLLPIPDLCKVKVVKIRILNVKGDRFIQFRKTLDVQKKWLTSKGYGCETKQADTIFGYTYVNIDYNIFIQLQFCMIVLM